MEVSHVLVRSLTALKLTFTNILKGNGHKSSQIQPITLYLDMDIL